MNQSGCRWNFWNLKTWESGILMFDGRRWMLHISRRQYCSCQFALFELSIVWIIHVNTEEGTSSLLSLLIETVIFYKYTLRKPRNNVLPAIWHFSPGKLKHKTNYYNRLKYYAMWFTSFVFFNPKNTLDHSTVIKFINEILSFREFSQVLQHQIISMYI